MCFAYIPPYYKDKLTIWQQTNNYVNQLTNHWILIGDLNNVLHESEKHGSLPFNHNKYNQFVNFLLKSGTIKLRSD